MTSPPSQSPHDRPSLGTAFEFVLFALCATVLWLAPAAQASAAEVPLTTSTEGSGAGTIECDVGSGPEACEAEYPEGTEIAFVAESNEGSEFVEWGGDCIGQTEECELTLEEATTVAAVFELEEVPLEITTEGQGLGEVECDVGSGPEVCEAEYPFGTEVALVAEPDPGSEFVEWTEDCTGNGACEVTMDEAHSVTAIFDLAHFALEIEFEGNGEGTVECEVESGPAEPCEATYLEGTEVALVAEPEEGSEFVEWEGDCSGNGPCELTMDEDHAVTANFALVEFALELATEGEGGGEIECEVESGPVEPCGAEYPFGTEVALVAEPDPGSEFVEWTEDCTGNGACEVTMDEEHSVTAVFGLIPEFTLEVEKEGAGSGTVTSSPAGINCGATCSAEFAEGETVTLTAEPSLGSEFGEWEGCDETSGVECEVTVDEDRIVVAIFKPEPPPSEFALTVSLAGTGSGMVTSSPAGISCGVDCSEAYAAGTEVTLTATAASGSIFSGWSGACTGAGACKVTMGQARSVTATFAKESIPPGPGTVSVASTAKVKSGKALLKLTCKGEGPCKGSLKLTAKIKSGGKTKSKTIGKSSFSLATGATTTLKVKLSGPAKQAVAKQPLKAKVSGSGVRGSTVKLKK